MELLNWNISYASNIDKIINLLKEKITSNNFIITLQEVTPSSYTKIVENFKENANIEYSLNYRCPSKYDTKARKLGIVIMTSKNTVIKEVNVLTRTLLPDRTLYLKININGKDLKIISLHSITGCDYKKAKSLQFNSFAETIDLIKPDIVTFDANEPKIDHYDVDKMLFYDNLDKGSGAKNFFTSLANNNLIDAYSILYDKNNFVYGIPLITSHIINKTNEKRYDFVFINKNKIDIETINYLLEESINASSDHSLIKTNFKIK